MPFTKFCGVVLFLLDSRSEGFDDLRHLLQASTYVRSFNCRETDLTGSLEARIANLAGPGTDKLTREIQTFC